MRFGGCPLFSYETGMWDLCETLVWDFIFADHVHTTALPYAGRPLMT